MNHVLHSNLPLYAILVSAFAVLGIVFFGERHRNARESVTLVAGLIKFALVLAMFPLVNSGKVLELTLFEILPGVPFQLRVDGLGMLFALVASSLWIVTSVYSIGYMRPTGETSQTRYYSFFALSLSATMGVAFSANLLTMYIFYELLSMATYPLVTHHNDKEARAGGRKYLFYLLSTSVGFVLPAMIYCYLKTGTLDFASGGFLAGHVAGMESVILLILLVYGFAKAGIMPFHSWLPGAMVAPTPVSSLLHAVAVVKVGVFSILRVMTGVFGIPLLREQNLGDVVSVIAGTTVILASLIALTQDNLKRRLAFSTVGQLSYIVLGVSLLTDRAVEGSMVHIAMHAFGKITLFFCAGAIYVMTGKKKVSQMKGLGQRMPLLWLCFLIGAMSVIGLPPTGGFASKWYMVLGAIDAGRPWVLVIYLISSFLNAAYFLPIVYYAFFCEKEKVPGPEVIKCQSRWAVLPPAFTALCCIAWFFANHILFQLAGLMTGGT